MRNDVSISNNLRKGFGSLTEIDGTQYFWNCEKKFKKVENLSLQEQKVQIMLKILVFPILIVSSKPWED